MTTNQLTDFTTELPLFEPGTYYSDKELAELTKTKARSWQNRRARKEGPNYLKFGRCVRYLGSDLNAWFKRIKTADSAAHTSPSVTP